MSDEDSDATIVEPYEIQSIIAKYKSWSSEDPQSSTRKEDLTEPVEINATILSDSKDEGPTPAKQLCEAKIDGFKDEVDEILEELSEKYNLNFDATIKDYDSAENDQNDVGHIQNPISPPDHFFSNNSSLASKAQNMVQLGHHLAKHQDYCASDKDHLENNDVFLETNKEQNNSESNQPSTKKLADLKKIEKAKLQLEKQMERQKKKEEAERDKEIKKALNAANKNLKPDECIKFITAIIDEEITKQPYGAHIERHVRELGAMTRAEAQIIPNTVTWVRKTQLHSYGNGGKLELSTRTEECEQIVLFLTWRECVNLIHARDLLMHVQQLRSVFGSKQMSIAIYGMQEYFKYLKRQKRNEVHDEVTGSQRSKKADKTFSDAPKLSRRDVEFALTELQMFASCCHRFIENPEDFGLLLAQFTKAIAQIPYKLEKQEKHMQADWYMSGSNKDCVRVDKNGNGLQRLWQQQLTVLPLARLETAEAILAKYPTLSSLMQAYDACTSEQEKRFLLQDIQIRRAAGPLTNARRLGPEFSKKIYTFFNMLQGNILI